MPNALPEARAFDVPDFFRFQKKEQRDVLDAMLNNENNDYSTVDELAKSDRLSQYSYEVIGDAVEYLTGRGFLHKVEKPYGCVYAVNSVKRTTAAILATMMIGTGMYAPIADHGA